MARPVGTEMSDRPVKQNRSARNTLSRELIVERALELIDRFGLEAFSMRRLAEELGVGTMTLYRYFRDKEELLDAVVDAAASAAPTELPQGSWRDQIRVLVKQRREYLFRHPALLHLRFDRPLVTRRALLTVEAGMQVLLRAGFSKREAARAYRTLFSYTYGFTAFSSRDDPEATKRNTLATLVAMPPEQYPAVAATSFELAEAMAGEEQFDYGLELLLDGLEARRA